jgi:hypothetical protein
MNNVHNIGNYELGNGFSWNLPVGKIICPISKKGWGKVRTIPDKGIESALCLEKAHLTALENLKASAQDSTSITYLSFKWQIEILSLKV